MGIAVIAWKFSKSLENPTYQSLHLKKDNEF